MKKLTLIQTLLVGSTLLLSANQTADVAYKTNFYKAVNQEWLNTHKIAEDKSSTSTFVNIDAIFIKNAKALISSLIKKENKSTDEQKLVDYYSSLTDTKTRNAKGVAPLKPILSRIDKVTSHEELAKLMTDMTHDGFVVPYMIGAMVDNDDATKYIMGVSQNGLSLQPKFYDNNSSTAVKKRENYLSYLRETLTLAKFEDVNKTVSEAMSVETLLAKSSYTVVQMQDVQLTHNSSDFTKLSQMLSHFDISGLFDKMGYPKDRKININTPKYLEALNQLFVDIPVERWKQYLKAKVVLTYSSILSDELHSSSTHIMIYQGGASYQARATRCTSNTRYKLSSGLSIWQGIYREILHRCYQVQSTKDTRVYHS